MQRSMMQVFVKGSIEAVKLYKTAFDADILCTYAAENGGYMHSELNAHGQIIAVSEIAEDIIVGNLRTCNLDLHLQFPSPRNSSPSPTHHFT